MHQIFLDFLLWGKSSNLWRLNKKMGGAEPVFFF